MNYLGLKRNCSIRAACLQQAERDLGTCGDKAGVDFVPVWVKVQRYDCREFFAAGHRGVKGFHVRTYIRCGGILQQIRTPPPASRGLSTAVV
jgi:hypothetical protein